MRTEEEIRKFQAQERIKYKFQVENNLTFSMHETIGVLHALWWVLNEQEEV